MSISRFWVLTKRELLSFFFTPTIYIMLFAFLLVQGSIFSFFISLNVKTGFSGPPLQFFFGGNIFFWLIQLILIPSITMRLFSEEYRQGTIESLMTTPVYEFEIVSAKFFAALIVYTTLWFPTLFFALYINWFSPIDFGPIISGYLGVSLLGFSFIGIGLWASSITSSQLISSFITFAVLVLLFGVGLLEVLFSDLDTKAFFHHLNLWSQMTDLGRGIIDTRSIIYHLTLFAMAFYGTIRNLETRKVTV